MIGLAHRVGRQPVLQDIDLSIEPGTLVAVAGGSGAGKSTLLQMLAGLREPTEGTVLHDGRPVRSDGPTVVGYVPQEDIIHAELPLRRTLTYAARLRLGPGTSRLEAERIVDETMRELDLADRADVRVGALSGGQRKRASTAVELLARPSALLLDEPTSGLDPSTAVEVLAILRRAASHGRTVVLSTHDPADIEACDVVIFLTRGGRLAFVGAPADARRYFEVDHLAHVYRDLASPAKAAELAERFEQARDVVDVVAPTTPPSGAATMRRPNAFGQWAVLTRRAAEVMARNRLTLAVLLGSPFLVTAMMAVLFRPGAFDSADAASLGPTQTVFWIAFSGFFFGLTYGLLQIVGEMAVFRRERLAGLSVPAYVVSKITVLGPVLAVVAATVVGVLRVLDRLPDAAAGTYGVVFVTLLLEALAALALGLLTSAAVADAAQATLALPMLCFPQVLFAGAVVPTGDMAAPGRAMSITLANRWAFESLGRAFGLDDHASRLPAMAAYRDAFAGSAATGWAVLALFTVLFTAATIVVLDRRSRPS